MKFLDRQAEMGRLETLVRRSEGGLAVVWGRRRIGKTRLLLEWCQQHEGVYTVADQSAPEVQRSYLAQALGRRFPGLDEATYPDWASLLRGISRNAQAQQWQGPLVFDEFPYLAAASPELPSQFQHWIDHEAKDARLVVALAGSSQRMMQGLVLDANAPLYGRAVELMQVGALPLGYLQPALGLKKAADCVRAYAVWGGVPRYWELAEPYGTDLERALDQGVLDPLGPLHREPDRLLLEELPSAASLRPVLDVIGMGVHRISEIAGRLGKPATSLTHALARLIDLGLVCREQPFGESEKSGKRSLYKISDPFFRCWFRLVAPHRALLLQAPARVRLGLWRQIQQTLFAETWEELCRQMIGQVEAKSCPLSQHGPWKPAARYWRGNEPEWDVVAESLSGETLLLGEVKYSDSPFTEASLKKHLKAVIAKGIPPHITIGRKNIIHALFIPETTVRSKEKQGVYLVTAQDVVASLH